MTVERLMLDIGFGAVASILMLLGAVALGARDE